MGEGTLVFVMMSSLGAFWNMQVFFSFLLASLPQHIKLHLFVSNLSLGCFNFFSSMETME